MILVENERIGMEEIMQRINDIEKIGSEMGVHEQKIHDDNGSKNEP